MSTQPLSPVPSVPLGITRTGKRPGWLTAVCVIAIVWGSIKLLVVVWGIIGAVFQSQIQELFAPFQMMGQPPQQKEAFEQYLADLNALMERWTPLTYTSYALGLMVGGCLLAGAIMTLNWKAAGWKLLVGVLWGGAALQLAGIVPTVIMQMQTAKIVDRYMSRMFQAQPGAPPMPQGMQGMMSAIAGASVTVGICMYVGWTALVVAAYVAGAIYLRRPAIRALFARPQAISAPVPSPPS